jgi:hypothetical protein
MDKMLLLVVENSISKSVWMILRRNMLNVKSLSLIPSCHSRRQSLSYPTSYVWLSHQISITEFMVKVNHYMRAYQIPLRRVRSVPRMMLRLELSYSMKNLIGIRMMPWEYGHSVQRIPEEIYWWTRPQESNTWMSWESPWNQLGNGQLRRLLCVMKIWEESELILLIVSYTLMLSTEVVDKLSQLQEDCIMHVN